MNGKLTLVVGLILFAYLSANASQIGKLDLNDLSKRSELIVMAKVAKVEKKALDSRVPVPYDEVTIKIASVLKGSTKHDELKIIFQPRGVKDFDPELKEGNTGVFFLSEVANSQAKLAYWGSVAVFEKMNFAMHWKRQKIRDVDFKQYLIERDNLVELCKDLGNSEPIHFFEAEYADLDGDGDEEAVVEAATCAMGTGGSDIFEVFKLLGSGKIQSLKINDGELKGLYEDQKWPLGWISVMENLSVGSSCTQKTGTTNTQNLVGKEQSSMSGLIMSLLLKKLLMKNKVAIARCGANGFLLQDNLSVA